MSLKALSESYPPFRCGYVSFCVFCEKMVWSGDVATTYIQTVNGQAYAHQACIHKDNLKCGAYASLRDKGEKPDWSRSSYAPCPGMTCMLPILTADEFNEYAADTFVQDGSTFELTDLLAIYMEGETDD